MRKLAVGGGVTFYQLSESTEVDDFKISNFTYFKSLGMIDYQKYFKIWLREFPRPIFIIAVKKSTIIGFIYVNEWSEAKASGAFMLREIEVLSKKQNKKIGSRLVILALQLTPGPIGVQPLGHHGAVKFFVKMGFKPAAIVMPMYINPHRDLKYYGLTLGAKRSTLDKFLKKDYFQEMFMQT